MENYSEDFNFITLQNYTILKHTLYTYAFFYGFITLQNYTILKRQIRR